MFYIGVHTHTGPSTLNLPLKRDSVFFTFPKHQVMYTLTVLYVLYIHDLQKCAFIFLPFSVQVVCEERVKEMESPQRLSKQRGPHSKALIADVGRGGTVISLIVSADQEDTKQGELP